MDLVIGGGGVGSERAPMRVKSKLALLVSYGFWFGFCFSLRLSMRYSRPSVARQKTLINANVTRPGDTNMLSIRHTLGDTI